MRTAAGVLPPETEWNEAERVEELFLPVLVAVGPDASLYVVDRSGRRLQRLKPDGTAQELSRGGGPTSIAITNTGSLLVADAGGLRTLHEGTWDRVENGSGLKVATSLGEDFITFDWRAHRILRLHAGAANQVLAGNGTVGAFGDGGPANGATFSCYDLVVGLQGETILSDTLNGRVALIRDGEIRTLASVGGALGLGRDAQGAVYVADQGSHRVLSIDSEGNVLPVAGNGAAGFSGDGGLATEAALSHPVEVAVTAAGEILISDSQNHRVRRVDTDGLITTFATFDEATGSLFLHPNGRLVVSLGGGRELVEFEPIGARAAVKLTGSTGSDDARSRREALGFMPSGEMLFVSSGQLHGSKGGEPARVVPLGSSSALTGAIRMAVAANEDLIVCDSRQRILRVRGTTLQDALTAVALR
jgi:sugar lactone lactonase YvrE